MIITYTDSARHGKCEECGKSFIRRAIDAADDGKLCRDCYLKQKRNTRAAMASMTGNRTTDTLHIRMTRGERRVADELRKHFGGFKRMVIDVDGERHEFGADSLVQMLEDYEDAQGMNNHMRLFGTPERAARTLLQSSIECNGAISYCDRCPFYGVMTCPGNLEEGDYDTLLEWLRGESE